MSKFSSDIEIKQLIKQYKEHDCLWNIHSPSYKDKSLKQSAWLEIANYFDKTPNEVKRKMQYLRAAYVHEKKRVDASKRSVTIHEPVLFYYKEMDFLDNIVIWRKFGDNKDACNMYSESIGSSQDFEVKEFIVNTDEYIQEPELKCKFEIYDEPDFNVVADAPISRTEPQSSTVIIKNGNNEVKPYKTSPLTSTTAKLPSKFLYDSFGKTVALQLQHLPLEDALLAMSEIQNILTIKTLEYIRNVQNDSELYSQSETEETCNEFIDNYT